MRPARHSEWWPFHWKERRWKRTTLPDSVRAAVALQPGERVLSYGLAGDGSAVVATDHGLWLLVGGAMERIDWERVATLAPSRRHLDLTLLDEDLGPPHRVAVDLRDPGEVVEAAWDQMADTTVHSEHVALDGARGVRVVGRRGPASDTVVWGLVPDPDLDLGDVDVRLRATEALFRVRREAGG